MTREEKLAADIRALKSLAGDPEAAHARADDLLLLYFSDGGHEDVLDAYEELVGECEWWACA